MKKLWKKTAGIFFAFLLAVGCLAVPAQAKTASNQWPAGPNIEAPSAILMEVSTGTVLYEKKADKKRYPASITKILTALVALENSRLDETVTFSAEAVYENEGDSSHIARDLNEQMTMEQCLYAVMLESANECAYAVAEHVGGGDYQNFIRMMNEKAKSLGCTGSHFTNSNGLPDEKHYTTCRDMALISREAIRNPDFRRIISSVRYTIPPTNKHKEQTDLNNHHQMISSNRSTKNLYDYAIGGKTGYTQAAQNTLVTFAEKDGMTLVCVVMKSSGSQYADTRALFEYGFNQFQLVNVSQNEERYDTVQADEKNSLFASGEAFAAMDKGAQIVLPKSADFNETTVEISYDNVTADILGTLIYSYEGRRVGSADVKTTGVTAQPYPFGETVSGDKVLSENSGGQTDINGSVSVQESTGNTGPGQTGTASRNLRQKLILIAVIAGAAVAAFLTILFLYNNINRIWRRRSRRDKRYKTIKNNRKWNKRGGR